MNHLKVLVVLALTTISCVTYSGSFASNEAQASPTTAAQSAPTTAARSAPATAVSKEFLSFWETFKDALRKNDKNALADMTKLPYTHQDKKLNKAAFVQKCEEIFPASSRKCLLRAKPVRDQNSVLVCCDDDIYMFAIDQGKYKFTEIGVND